MSIRRDDIYYDSVPFGQEYASEQVPDNGKVWIIESVDFNAPSTDSGWIALIWDYEGNDEEILALTYESKEKALNITIEGDGTKKLALVLHNEGLTTLTMGGSYSVKEL